MKSIGKFLLLVLFAGIISVFAWQCNDTVVGPAVQQYSYLDPVVNPPDTFQLLYNLNSNGDKSAYITFQDSAVWQVRVLSNPIALFGVIDPKDSSWNSINTVDTLGFRGALQYTFVANNNNYEDLSTYAIQFTKLPIDYNSFSKKY